MKTVHKTRSGGESCSCTTCIYKSESDNPSVRRIIDLGSRIDRLYYGKYIPLRERKLLERLVRTRAVYDDIRAQLVSDSTLSLSTKGDFNPRKNVSVRELDDTEKSSGAVLELVNMVDRGAIGSKKLDDCCSCCSCSSKIKIHEHRHRQPRTYGGAAEYLARQRRLRETQHRKKGVRFKTKHIRSDPCTCTFKLIKKHSKAIYKKMHQRLPAPLFELQPDEEVKQDRKRIGDIARKSYQNLIDSNTRMKEKISGGMSKLRESKTRIQEKIEYQTKLSMEKFNQAKDKLASKVRTGAQEIREINRSEFGPENESAFQVKKDSISKFKEALRRKQIMKDWECEPECIKEICVPEECFIQLKQKNLNPKNIHPKGMSYNIKAQERKAGEPLRQSNYKIQAQKLTKVKTIATSKPVLATQQTRGIKGSRVTCNCKKSDEINVLRITPVTAKPEKISLENVKASHPDKKAKSENSSLESRQAVRIGSSFSFNIEFYKDKPRQEISVVDLRHYTDSKQHPGIDYRHEKPVKDRKTKKRRLRHHGSQIETKKSLKDTQSGGHALKRCFCTLKLKAKGNKWKTRSPVTKKIMTTETSALILDSPTILTSSDVQTNTDSKRKKGIKVRTNSNLLPYECEPGICLPGQCDPYQCIKLINIREGKLRNSRTQARKTKSTSSFTSRSYKPSKAKKVQSKFTHRSKASTPIVKKQRIRRGNAVSSSHRQAVRIGSTFSFNVEFYKNNPHYQHTTRYTQPLELKSLSRKPKQKEYRKVKLKNRGYQGLGNEHKNTPTQIIKKERNARIGTTLKRCFCTLALQRKDIIKNHSTKPLTTGTETSELKPIDTANKGTKTKLKYYLPLEPYECEPYTCIPGACDPYICLQRINMRNKRLKEFGFTTDHLKTTSSSVNAYPEKSLKTAQVQYKPRHKERKVLAKTQKSKKYAEINNNNKNDVSKYPVSAKSGQAVRMGSTFSFDIEFYKNKSPTQEIKQMDPTEGKIKVSTSKRSVNKRIKTNNLNVAQEETQVEGTMKRDKGSVVGPLLKRCFCTLNLQKKWKHQYSSHKDTFPSERLILRPQRVYTVNRATIEYTQGIAYNKNQNTLHGNINRDQLNKSSPAMQHIDNVNGYKICNKCEPIKVKSDYYAEKQKFEMSQQFKETSKIRSQQCVKRLEKFIAGSVDTIGFTRNSSLSSNIHEIPLTSLTRYFRRCFYTMNLKVEDRENYKQYADKESVKRNKHKLLPYECEPGVCIPDECNPYDCQKMIAKRLIKSFSKKSGTSDSSLSISCSANQPLSKAKDYKQQTLLKKSRRPQVFKEKSQIYKKTAKYNQKKAVRIGSSFSFDIEFSKNLSTLHKNVILPKYSSDTNLAKQVKHSSKSKGIGERRKNSDSQSQTASLKTMHKGSFTRPSVKRCFCTLKLQKKGRLHKEFKNQTNPLLSQPVIPLSELSKEKTVSRGQNTKKVKRLKLTHALKPYECEPNVCIPGQCDPNECLEKIKLRNYHEEEVGTNTVLHKTKPVASMNTDNQSKIKHRSRAVDVKSKIVANTWKDGKHYPDFNQPKPLRQAVHLGSNFSFNIEFFKDQPSHSHHTPTSLREMLKENKQPKEPSRNFKKYMDNYTKNKRNLQHKQSQFENITRHASTLTNSFIRRCFCTAQLYKSKNTNDLLKPERNVNSPSFVKRCLCALRKMKPALNNTMATDVKHTKTENKKMNTRKIKDKPKYNLYEFKPDICAPGECDPYICDKIIRKYRNVNFQSTTVDTIKTRSISCNGPNIAKNNVKTMKRNENENIKNRTIKDNNKPKATLWSPDRNVVRIGSNFSFDIEFFKDHPVSIKHINQKSVRQKAKLVKDTDNKKKVKINSTKTFSPSYISQSSQVKKKEVKDRGIGINNFMKRCFCTLKLNEKNKYNHKSKRKEIYDNQISKKVSTKSVMTVEKNDLFRMALLPYECEPNSCIPYQCDPYECEKRIKLRHKNQLNREFGVSTSSPNKVSAYSITDNKKPKTKNLSTMKKEIHQNVKQTPHMYSDTGKIGQSKQSVRIGSTFSFNVEFFKDEHHDGFELQKLPKKDHYTKDQMKSQVRSRRKNYPNQMNHGDKKKKTNQTQFDKKIMNTNQTQFVNQVTRTKSTMTGFTPKKRCFCTLSLKKSKAVLPPLPVKTTSVTCNCKLLHASTETDALKTIIHPVSNLLPYECEPNFCVPDECNPVQCLERIKRRQDILLRFECEPNVCVPGKCNPAQCLEKIKKSNKTKGTAMEDLHKKNVATITKKRKDAKNKKAQSKQFQQLNSKKIYKQKNGGNNNRQAVHIGSNFSFDIEFFKTNNPNYMGVTDFAKRHHYSTKHQLKNKAANSDFEEKKLRNRELQSTSPKKISRGSSVSHFLKRCFCTLKLQKAQVNKTPITVNKQITNPKKQPKISSENKSTVTRKFPMNTYNLSPFECEPFYCTPGECDPYECAKRIKMREKKHKTQYTIAQSHTRSHKGVRMKQDNMKSQKSQASFIDKNVVVPKSNISRPDIVETLRFTNTLNKQAVRIGSNFSFNMKFYKENLPLTGGNPIQIEHGYDKKIKEDKTLKQKVHKNIHHREQNTNMTSLRSSGSKYDKPKTGNKSVGAGNILKRCFCTLKLQNQSSSETKKQNIQSMIQFPQNFEVRRVAVEHNSKMLSKEKQIVLRSKSTKMNKKKLKKNADLIAPCNLYFSENYEKLLPEDMKTIMPYMPEKFNKTVSRTVIPQVNKYNKLKESMLTNRGKRLNRKRSEKYLHKKQPKNKTNNAPHKSFLSIKNFISWCAKIFHPKSNAHNFALTDNLQNKRLLDAMKSCKSERQTKPNQLITNLNPKKFNQTCPYHLIYQNGVAKQCAWPPGMSDKLDNKQITKPKPLTKKSNIKQQIMIKNKYNKNRTCTCSMKLLNKKQHNRPKSLIMNKNKQNKKEIIKKDKGPSCPLRVCFLDTTVTKNKPQSEKTNVKSLPNSKKKRMASSTKSDHVIKSSNSCHPCRGKITKEEYQKAAGDQPYNQEIVNKKRSPGCSIEKIVSKIRDKMRCAINTEKPLFEMQVDSGSYEILNRNEVVHNVAKLKTKCKPIIELQVDPKMRKILNKRAVIDDIVKRNTKKKENCLIRSIKEIGISQEKTCPCRRGPKTAKVSKIRKPTGKPCICGSSVCAKNLENMKTPRLNTRHKLKNCVCGSPVCDRESAKIKALSAYVKNKCLCQKEMAKRKAKKLKKEKKGRAIRLKLYEKSDKMRSKKRKKEQKKLERKIDKKATDGVLFAESVLDVGKFGITATTGLIRDVAKCARDPKQAIQTLRTLEENPMLVAKFLKSTYHDTGLTATLRRVRLRCLAMRGMKKLRRQLDSYPVTHFLLNVASNDPKRRSLKKKKKRKELPKRERLDFDCSLYMASLRKRPYLSVYDRCPWFYQHFLSLVYAWKQFIDICLFLLAAVVWSPCILCMEICRACMCCFFCTG